MIGEFVITHLGELLTGLITGFVTWLFTRRKQNAETNTVEIDNGKRIIEIYQQTLNDLEARHKEQFEELKTIYESKFQGFKIQIESFNLQIDNLHKELELWKNKYTASQEELKKKK